MSTLPNECSNPENPNLFGPTIYISVVEGQVHMYVATIVYFIYFTSFCVYVITTYVCTYVHGLAKYSVYSMQVFLTDIYVSERFSPVN